jgi:hypothetical protein
MASLRIRWLDQIQIGESLVELAEEIFGGTKSTDKDEGL